MKISCGIFTNIAPLYTRALWTELIASGEIDYTFYASGTGFSGIKTIEAEESQYLNRNGRFKWVFLKNLYFRDILVFQRGIISKFLWTNHDAYILCGEMHTISNWIVAIICRIRNKPLLYWGHGFYGNERLLKKWIRNFYYKIADYHLVYGNRSRNLMINQGFPPPRIFTVYNSLDHNSHTTSYREKNKEDLNKIKSEIFPEHPVLPVIVFIGRLTPEKKISYLLEAVSISKLKENLYNCLIVGGGDELDNLKRVANTLGITNLVCFFGPCYDEKMNAQFIMLSECCVSPGNVGLTAIHSLSLGTPVITHNNMYNQGPEAEAIIQNKTGMFFEENNVSDLSTVLDKMILNNLKSVMESSCIKQVKDFWNPVNQAGVFSQAILKSIEDKDEHN